MGLVLVVNTVINFTFLRMPMVPEAGNYLYCTATQEEDAVFGDAVVYLASAGERGALGFVVNREMGRSLNDLTEFADAPHAVLYKGGPVACDMLFVLHAAPEWIEGGVPAGGRWMLGGQMDTVRTALELGVLAPTQLRLFVGYCGWDPGQLETEIAEGYWVLGEGDALDEG